MRTILTVAALAAAMASAGPATAYHNNPWAEDSSSLEGRMHDTNQSFSEDRPGEDEMHGVENSKGRDSVPGPGGRNGRR